MEAEILEYTCEACGFTTQLDLMLLAHQAQCDNIELGKRDFRMAILALMFPEKEMEEALKLARQQKARQSAELRHGS